MSARTWTPKDGVTHYEGTFRCPHCGHENATWFRPLEGHPKVFCCDVDSGGCDTYFAITARIEVTVTVTPRKIEGIAPDPAGNLGQEAAA